MKKIVLSIAMILGVGAIAAGATWAFFSDQAEVTDNTFATGTLEIRVNGQPTISGANFSAIAPGDYKVFQHNVNNYGLPWFSDGLSNLTARKLSLNITNPNDYGSGLWNEVYVKVEVNTGWPTWQQVYWGKLKDLANVDLLSPRYTELAPGNSEDIKYTLWIPETGTSQNHLMGKTLTWDFVLEGRTN